MYNMSTCEIIPGDCLQFLLLPAKLKGEGCRPLAGNFPGESSHD